MSKVIEKETEILECVKNHKHKEILNIKLAEDTISLLQCDEYNANDKICEQCRKNIIMK